MQYRQSKNVANLLLVHYIRTEPLNSIIPVKDHTYFPSSIF